MYEREKKAIFKYIMLKIQLREWGPTTKIPSERFFAIKFNVTRGLIKSIFQSLKSNGVILSLPKKGYLVNKEWNNFLEINNYKNKNHVTKKLLENIDPDLLEKINSCLMNYHINLKVEAQNFVCVKKIYFDKEQKINKIIKLYIPQTMFNQADLKHLDDSIMYFYGINDYVIARKIMLREEMPNYVLRIIKLIFDLDNNLLGIYKIDHLKRKRSLNLLFEKRLLI